MEGETKMFFDDEDTMGTDGGMNDGMDATTEEAGDSEGKDGEGMGDNM